MRILHFTPSVAPSDGVTNGVLLATALCRELGLEALPLSAHIPAALNGVFQPFENLAVGPEDILFYHHSVGLEAPVEDWLQAFPGRRWMIYHNITPPFYFEPGSIYDVVCRLGRTQLKRWVGLFDAALADSDYNSRELRFAGYRNVETLPLLITGDDLLSQARDDACDPCTREAWLTKPDALRLLFVGRIAPNKCQHQLITLLPALQAAIAAPVELHLLGGISVPSYRTYLDELVRRHGLESSVFLPGKVTDPVRNACLREADLYLSLSEHEGFGIPLLEAMAAGCPVAAYASGAIGQTLGGAGRLLRNKHPDVLVPEILALLESPLARRKQTERQYQRLQEFSRSRLLLRLADFLSRQGLAPVMPVAVPMQRELGAILRLEGPFDSHYSLALVNREIARAARRSGATLHLHNTEGGGDYPLDRAFIEREAPDLLPSFLPGGRRASVGMRNLFPPRISRLAADLCLLGPYGWEESQFPDTWVSQINHHAHGVVTMSTYVKKTLQDNGVTVPIKVVGLGVDHLDQRRLAPTVDWPWGKAPYLLHVSSAFPRKGCDALFAAFERAHLQNEVGTPIGLVIKTFDNPHNQIPGLLGRYGWELCEQIEGGNCYSRPGDRRWIAVLTAEMPPARMAALYQQARALVVPTRGEGFGLPQAEAMLFGCPVVTTAAGGQADFCTEETAWLIEGQYQEAKTHLAGELLSLWFEPDEDALQTAMVSAVSAPTEVREARCHAASKCIRAEFTWDQVFARTMAFARQLASAPVPPATRLVLVSTWNSRCGIAEHSRYLSVGFPIGRWRVLANTDAQPEGIDDECVTRCWASGGGDSLVELADNLLAGSNDEQILIQFNFSFFALPALGRLIGRLADAGRDVSLFFHSTADVLPPHELRSLREILPALARCARLYVHTPTDLNHLRSLGLEAAATMFPQGVPVPQIPDSPAKVAPVLMAYGFMLPQKGFFDLVEAFDRIKPHWPELQLHLMTALHPAPISAAEASRVAERCRQSPYASSIVLDTTYQPETQIQRRLAACLAVIYPYRANQESSSAAVRFGLASRRPVLITPCSQFDDIAHLAYMLPGESADEIADGILSLRSQIESHPQAPAQTAWVSAHNWHRLGRRMWRNQTALRIDRWLQSL